MLTDKLEETMRYSVCIALLLPTSAWSATLTVGASGTYSTISDAIGAASSGDTIEVSAGTYNEMIRVQDLELEIIGVDGADSTLISSGSSPALVVGNSSSFTVSGFTLSATGERGFEITESTGELSDLSVNGHSVFSNGAGGIIEDSEVDIADCSFDDNNANSYDGGNLYIRGSEVNVSTSSFSSGAATYGAGLYIGGTSVVTVSDSGFTANNVEGNQNNYGHGGGVRISESTATLTDCTFTDNYGGDDARGGTIAIRASTLTIDGAVITNSSAGRDGGALYIDDSTLSATDLSVDRAYAGFKGGAMTAYSSDITVADSDFTNSYAEGSNADSNNWTGSGGAFFLSEAPAVISGSTFEGNSSESVGGAIYTDDDLTMSTSSFQTNESPYGAGLYLDDAAGDIETTDFSENTASNAGGAIRWRDDTFAENLTISESSFSMNSCGDDGGAIAVYAGATITIADTSFAENTGAEGGALYLDTVNVELDGTTFSANNGTSSGGAIRWVDSDNNDQESFIVERSLFEDNSSDSYGGAFAIRDGVSAIMNDNVFYNNVGVRGGAISIYDIEDVTSIRNEFCGNVASEHAGAVRLNQSGSGENTWKNNVYLENAAVTEGGALYILDSGYTEMINNTLLGNSAATGGGVYLNDSDIDFINNIVAWTVDGYAIQANAGASGSVEYFDLYTNTPDDLGGSSSIALGATGINSNPSLRTVNLDGVCGNDQLWPSTGSPVIDAGDPSITDLDGTTSDIGAYGGPDAPIIDTTSDDDGDGYTVDLDCNDQDAAINPSATEICNGVDDDCDGFTDDSSATGQSTFYFDLDGDGYGLSTVSVEACDAPNGYVADNTDCDDNKASVNPGAVEICDGLDNDCNTAVDDNVPNPDTWYQDSDGDGFGDSATVLIQCNAPTGYVGVAGDCDDTDATVSPAASEICNNVDDDCNGDIDDNAVDGDLWFEDSDGDNFGNPLETVRACSVPAGYTENNTDCNDNNADTFPGAPEECTATVDYNCDGQAGDPDSDNDGFAECVDCDDNDPSINPAATEIWYDAIDQNCDEASDFDQDGDGYDAADFDGEDCDDLDAAINPGVEDPKGDDIDSNCDEKDGINPKFNDPAPTEALLAASQCGCAVTKPASSALLLALLPLLAMMRRRESAAA
jgi:predicted outer membrane repeat protein